jgi:hypothetical protein
MKMGGSMLEWTTVIGLVLVVLVLISEIDWRK